MPTPDFIVELRKKIGHDPLWLIGVTAYVEDAHGHVLLERRADNGKWALASGICEPGEGPAATVKRELLEEAGLAVQVRDLAALRADPRMLTYPNGDQCQYLDLLFTCEVAAGACPADAHVTDDESLELGWFAPDDLPEPVVASTRERIALAQEFLAQSRAGDPRPLFAH